MQAKQGLNSDYLSKQRQHRQTAVSRESIGGVMDTLHTAASSQKAKNGFAPFSAFVEVDF
jgi:hypothetical protein